MADLPRDVALGHLLSEGNDQVLKWFLSDRLETVLNQLPNGDARRAQGFSRASTYVYSHYERTENIDHLDHAVALMEKAIDESSNSEDAYDEYLSMWTMMLSAKAKATGELSDLEAHIAGLEKQVGSVTDNSMRETARSNLGMAYLLRCGRKEGVWEDFNLVVETLELSFKRSTRIWPPAMLDLGLALLHRESYRRCIDDLRASVDWLCSGIQLLTEMEGTENYRKITKESDIWPRSIASLLVASDKLNNEQLTSETLTHVTHTLGMTMELRDSLGQISGFRQLHELYICLLMRQFFRVPTSTDELSERFKDENMEEESNEDQSEAVGWRTSQPNPNSGTFSHQPLSDDKGEIRLISLLPGQRQDTIQCRLSSHIFPEAPKYDALSYEWGGPHDTLGVCLDGLRYPVTKNLHAALVRLRSTSIERTLWIDAICIDQKNLVEKSRQLLRMGEIYATADSVIMWLGEPAHVESPLKSSQTSGRDSSAVSKKKDRTGKKRVRDDTQHRSKWRDLAKRVMSDPEYNDLKQQLIDEMHSRYEEEMEWLKPVLHGTKKASDMPYDSLISGGFFNERFKKISLSQKLERLSQNIQARQQPGPVVYTFNWRSISTIGEFFRTPHNRTLWPVLGAISILFCFASDLHFNELPFFNDPKEEDIAYQVSQVWQVSARTLCRILDSSYWNRAWILQEMIIAEKPLVYYGPHVIPLDLFMEAQSNFGRHYRECCAKWGNNAYRKDHTYWTSIGLGLSKMHDLKVMRDAFRSRSTTLGHRDDSLSLRSLLISGQGSHRASDPRDMVYSLLGLIPPQDMLLPDYTQSVGQVFAHVAFRIMCDQQSLQLLTVSEDGRNENLEIPSWVSDWSMSTFFKKVPYNYESFQATYGRPYHARLLDDLGLEIETALIDEVEAISQQRTPSWSSPSKLVKLMNVWHQLSETHHDKYGEERVHERELNFWKAVFADTMEDYDDHNDRGRYRRFRDGDLVKIMKWWKWFQDEAGKFIGTEWHAFRTQYHEDGHHILTDIFWRSTEARKLILTSGGRIGTGPSTFPEEKRCPDVAVGDEIHLASGCNLPIILRPIKNEDSTGSHNAYEFVGTCYIPVVNGRAMFDNDMSWKYRVLY